MSERNKWRRGLPGTGPGSGRFKQEVCECGHYRTAHDRRHDVVCKESQSVSAGSHGPCDHCSCERFTWAGYAAYNAHRPPVYR